MLLRDVIPDEASWCQGAFGRDTDGKECHPRESSCVKRCLIGGLQFLYFTYDGGNMDEWRSARDRMKRILESNPRIFYGNISEWQDTATWEEVSKVIDEFDSKAKGI